jgi:hypothetical protein
MGNKMTDTERPCVKAVALLDVVAMEKTKSRLISIMMYQKKKEYVRQFAEYCNTRICSHGIQYYTPWNDLHDIIHKTVINGDENNLNLIISWLSYCGKNANTSESFYRICKLSVPMIDALYDFCKSVMDGMSELSSIVFCPT